MPWPQFDADHVMVTSSQMTIIEEQLFKSGLPDSALMEKVGLAIADWIFQKPELLTNGALVLVGPGHNGGDGLVVARELKLSGFDVQIWCPFLIKKPLTAQYLSHVKWLGIEEVKELPDVNGDCLWIDALFGLGQSRPLPKYVEELFEERSNRKSGLLLSIDIPSGICSDSGKVINNTAANASYTITVGLVKQGLLQDISLPYVGKIVRIDIGLPDFVLNKFSDEIPLKIGSNDISAIPWPIISANSMKYERGRVLIIAGSDIYPGASLLSLKGALASGVGSVQAFLPKSVSERLWQVAPEVLVKGVLGDSDSGCLSLRSCLQEFDLEKVDCVLLGPGLGPADESFLKDLNPLAAFKGLLVIDADGLNRLADSSESWKWFAKREGPTWLTPHREEFARLFPELSCLNSFDASRKAALISGVSVLLKGAHTVISAPDGNTWQLETSSPFAARAGWGDVLAGFASGIGAISCASSSGFDHHFLAIAALMHSESALRCKTSSNASDIAEFLANLTKEVQEKRCIEGHSSAF